MGLVRVAVVSVVVVGLLGAAGAAVVMSPIGESLRGGGNDEGFGTEVRMEPVELGDIVRTVGAPGSIEPRTLVQISSQVSARVLAVPFEEGDFVQEGDVVMRLDPEDLVAILDSAKAGLKGQQARLGGSEARLINARLEFERLRSLYETGDVTKSELDASEANYLQAQSDKQALEHGIEQAQAQIDQAEQDLENTVITSPMDGLIIALNAEVGETVIVGTTNNPGSVIMEIADLSDMLLEAAVDEANIAPVEEGQEATIYINAYSDREYRGTVKKIGNKRRVASDGTGTFEVEIEIELAEGETLFSGLTASTDIAVEHFYDTIIVPSQAVVDRRVEDLPREIRDESEVLDKDKTIARVVYRVVDGKTVATPVQAGASNLTHTQIVAGLSTDDVIVTGPFRELVNMGHDQRVRDEDAEDEAEGDDASEGEDDADGESGDESNDDSGDEDTEEPAAEDAVATSGDGATP